MGGTLSLRPLESVKGRPGTSAMRQQGIRGHMQDARVTRWQTSENVRHLWSPYWKCAPDISQWALCPGLLWHSWPAGTYLHVDLEKIPRRKRDWGTMESQTFCLSTNNICSSEWQTEKNVWLIETRRTPYFCPLPFFGVFVSVNPKLPGLLPSVSLLCFSCVNMVQWYKKSYRIPLSSSFLPFPIGRKIKERLVLVLAGNWAVQLYTKLGWQGLQLCSWIINSHIWIHIFT